MTCSRFLFGALCGLLLSNTALAKTGTLSYNMSYQGQFGQGGNGDGEFDQVRQIILDPTGNLLIADAGLSRIQQFDRDGNYLLQFGSFGTNPGQFEGSRGMVLGPNNTFLVGDSRRVQILDQGGNTLGYIDNGFNSVHGMFYNAAGELYIASYNSGEIQVFTHDGSNNYTYNRTVATAYLGNPEYTAIAPDGRYYVANYSGNNVLIFNADDSFAGYLTTPGNGPGETNGPSSVSVDAYGNVYVMGYNDSRVQIFDKDNNYLTEFGNNGNGDGQFSGPEGIFVGPDGRVYISDTNNRRVQILNFTSTETFTGNPTNGDETATTPYAILNLENTGNFTDKFIGYSELNVNGTDWTLHNANEFAVSAHVSAGNLWIWDTLTAPTITVDNGANIGSDGTLVGNVTNNGAITPGGNWSMATMNITGNYTDSATSIYNVNINAAGQNDLINVTGDITLNNGTINIIGANGSYAANTDYTLMTAGGNLTGTFGTINHNLAFMTPTVTYDGHNVFLNVANPNAATVDFVPYAGNASQTATANALNAYNAEGFNNDTALANTVLAFNTQEAAAFLKQTTPEDIAALTNTQTQSLTQIQSPLWQRMASLPTYSAKSYGMMSEPSVDNAQGFALLSPASGGSNLSRNFWMEAIGGVLNQDRHNGSIGYRSTVAGGRAGVDHAFSDTLTVGISGAYLQTKTSFDQSMNEAESNYGHVDVYARKDYSGLLIEGFIGVGAGQIETTRHVTVAGINRKAEGDAFAYDTNAALKLSHMMPVSKSVSLIPSVTTAASWQRQNGFTEDGAGALNLKMDSVTVTPVTIKPMLNVEKTFDNRKNGFNIIANAGAGATWQINERQSSVTAGFDQATNVPQFSVKGVKQKPFSANFVAGFTVQPTGSDPLIPSVSFTAASQMNSTNSNHTGTVHVGWKW